MKKRGSALIWILIILILIVGIIVYFSFFHISENKAKEILKSDYTKSPDLVCKKFIVNDANCANFVNCYSDKAINSMPKNLLVQFARDIKAGKSRAIDSYSLVNSKQIGENFISQILGIPDNVNINMI